MQAISYQFLLSESPQLSYLILKHETTCIKGSKNICFLIFNILSGTINQSIIWVASSSFMESSTYFPPDPHFNLFLSFLKRSHIFRNHQKPGVPIIDFWRKSIFIPGWKKLAAFRRGQKGLKIFAFYATNASFLRVIANLQI